MSTTLALEFPSAIQTSAVQVENVDNRSSSSIHLESSYPRNGDSELGGPQANTNVPENSANNVGLRAVLNFISHFLGKMKGVEGKSPPTGTIVASDIIVSSVLAFCAIFLIAITDHYYLSSMFIAEEAANSVPDVRVAVRVLTGAFGATAVILFDAYQSPLAQPRNVLGGFFVASTTGVCVQLFGDAVGAPIWVQAPLAVSLAIAVMRFTKCMFPPAGSAALIAVIGGSPIKSLHFGYVLCVMGAGIICLGVALVGNNLTPWRQYPMYWT